ncbi:hypothetical protein DXA21_22635 [Parabacteroides distasonis]|nr:hypothetical protein DXA21_22635 [Parabacteroides distasonis]
MKIGFKRNDKDGFSLEHELIKAEKALSAKEISAQKRLCITGLVICVAEKALSAKEISAQKRLCITGLVICVACMLLSFNSVYYAINYCRS